MKRLILILSAICLGCQSASDYSHTGRNLEITFAEIEEISSKSGETTQEEKSEIPQEQKINTVDLFIFNTAGKLENRTRFTSDIYLPKTVSVTTAGEKTIYAIANADGNINLENLPNNDAITTSDIESLEIFHKNIHTSLPYVSKTKQEIDLLTTPKVELKFQRIHAKVEIINQTPEQLTISAIEIFGLPSKAYLFKTETPTDVTHNQKSTETTFYTFATEKPITIDLTAEVNRTTKKAINEIPKLVTSETNIINITKVDNSEIKILGNDDWQGYQSSGIHQLGDISVVSEGANFSTDGTLLTYSNTTDYTLSLTAPNYTIQELTLKSNQPWLTISKATNPYKITIQKNDKEEERSAILSINKSNTSIKYIIVKQAKQPIIYYIQEPIEDNTKQKLADILEVAGGTKSGVLSVELSAHETLAPFAMDAVEGITKTNENLTSQTLKLNLAQIKAGQVNKRATTLKINRAGTTPGTTSEVASIAITQTPHTLSVPDYTTFVAINPQAQTNSVTAAGADPKHTWSATAKDTWLTATKSDNNLTLQPTNNTSAERTTKVDLIYDGTTLEKSITQTAGYAFTLSTSDAIIVSDNLKAYSIAKTYTVTITSNVAINFSTVSATITGQPTWTLTQPAGTGTSGTFTMKLPANAQITEPEATITLKIGTLIISTLKITQAKKVTFSQASPYDIIGGESPKTVIIVSSTWDIASQTPTNAAGLTLTANQAASNFTIAPTATLSYNTAKKSSSMLLKNDKGETISTYNVTQTPVVFTISPQSFTGIAVAGETKTSTVSTTNSLAWTVNTPTYNPTGTNWLTATNVGGNSLSLVSARNTTTSQRSATVTLISKGTTSQPITLTQNPGYNFTLSTTSATMASDNLKAYSIAKTYTVTITSNTAVNFNNVTITSSNSSWTVVKQTTTTATTGTFTITLPAATSTTSEPEATITLKVDGYEVKTMKVTQAKKVTFNQATPYNIIGGESTKPVVTIYASAWDIASQTPASTTGLTITTNHLGSNFTINAAATLNYSTAKTTNSLALKNDKAETIATYQVSQSPVSFTIATTSFTNLNAGGGETSTTVSTTGNLAWTVNTPTYNPTTSTGWLTAVNQSGQNTTLKLTISRSTLTTTRSAKVTLTSKGTTSQEISVTQKVGLKSNEEQIGDQVWLKYNVGTSPGSLATTLPSSNWESSKGGYYNWQTSHSVCPSGYHLPSLAEYDILMSNTNKSWLKNGTKLYLKLTDKVTPANTLEFSAAGYYSTSALTSEGTHGIYWSSTELGTDAYGFYFYDGSTYTRNRNEKTAVRSVRCLLE